MSVNNPLRWLLFAAVVTLVVGSLLALAMVKGPAPNAAVTIRRALIALAAAPVVLGGMGILIKQWWDRRTRHQRLEEAMEQAEIYARMQGSHPRPQPRRQATPSSPDSQTIQIVLPAQDESTYRPISEPVQHRWP
jgi:xanthosine utilization system XapX-like protein